MYEIVCESVLHLHQISNTNIVSNTERTEEHKEYDYRCLELEFTLFKTKIGDEIVLN